MISLCYPDRRTGFDRRGTSRYLNALKRLRSQPRAIAALVGLILVLNAADLALTGQALERGATEANPIMAWMFDQGMMAASTFKLAVGFGIALVIWRLRKYRRVLELSLTLAGIFTLVLAYHLVGWLVFT